MESAPTEGNNETNQNMHNGKHVRMTHKAWDKDKKKKDGETVFIPSEKHMKTGQSNEEPEPSDNKQVPALQGSSSMGQIKQLEKGQILKLEPTTMDMKMWINDLSMRYTRKFDFVPKKSNKGICPQ